MDKLQQYRNIIQQILTEQAHPYTYSNDVEAEIICDTEHDRYQLAYVGWKAQQRIFSVILHFDIKDGKIWIQHNGTEFDIAIKLAEMGIAKQNIVNGFHSSYMRQFTEFAVS